MGKQAISVTLSRDNLLWLKARTASEQTRSISETLDRLIASVRGATASELRSVVGTVTINDDDPDLSQADAQIRNQFSASLGAGPDGPKSRRATPRG